MKLPTSGQTELLLGKPLSTRRSVYEDNTRFSFDRLETKLRGRGQGPVLQIAKEPISSSSEAHLITIAPTGSGKGRNAIIPNLLSYAGPVVVIDPKGENYEVTSRRRREMGHEVICLDPFGKTSASPPSSLNPLDAMRFIGQNVNDEARSMTELIMSGPSHQDPFWDNLAGNLLSGIIGHLSLDTNKRKRSISEIRKLLAAEDVVERLKLIALDPETSDVTREDIESVLALGVPEIGITFRSVVAFATQWVMPFGSDNVSRSIATTSFDLNKLKDGSKLSIYIAIPPAKLRSHRALLRIWVGSLLMIISSRTKNPAERTLFMVDEAAQLGTLQILEQAITLLRGSGLQVWSFWQDLSQMQSLYVNSWPTILNNCSILQFFGSNTHMVVKSLSEITGVDSVELSSIERNEQLLFVNGNGFRAAKWDYLGDESFFGLFDSNPSY